MDIVDSAGSFRMRRLWILWRHEYDDIKSRDVINDATNRSVVGTFPRGPY